jgi:hypothetical protein
MTAASPPPEATGQLRRPAGIGAVALAVLIAMAVAGLFLVLIGLRRSDQPAAPEHHLAPPVLSTPRNPTNRWWSPAQRSALPRHDAPTSRTRRSSGGLSNNSNTVKGEQKQ